MNNITYSLCLVDLSSTEESSDSEDSDLDTEIAEESDAGKGIVFFLVFKSTFFSKTLFACTAVWPHTAQNFQGANEGKYPQK